MSAERTSQNRKPQSNSTLKSLAIETQEEVVEFAHANSLKETRVWLAEKKEIKTSEAALSRFLRWFSAHRQMDRNSAIIEALKERDQTPKQFLNETEVENFDSKAQLKAESLALQRDRLKLDRDKFERTHIETIITMCNHPTVREIAEDDDLSYGEKVEGIRKIMFGDQ